MSSSVFPVMQTRPSQVMPQMPGSNMWAYFTHRHFCKELTNLILSRSQIILRIVSFCHSQSFRPTVSIGQSFTCAFLGVLPLNHKLVAQITEGTHPILHTVFLQVSRGCHIYIRRAVMLESMYCYVTFTNCMTWISHACYL